MHEEATSKASKRHYLTSAILTTLSIPTLLNKVRHRRSIVLCFHRLLSNTKKKCNKDSMDRRRVEGDRWMPCKMQERPIVHFLNRWHIRGSGLGSSFWDGCSGMYWQGGQRRECEIQLDRFRVPERLDDGIPLDSVAPLVVLGAGCGIRVGEETSNKKQYGVHVACTVRVKPTFGLKW